MKFFSLDCVGHFRPSPPVRGAWIEIVPAPMVITTGAVAPREGGVD